MFGIGMPELIVILVVLLVVFGPGKIPQLGAALGGAIRSFKDAAEEPKAPAKKDGNQV
ncbi:MAG TPA: twin-arginine translocase TatA/TatE family subunit [Verrucomicrobiae bacterium]|nr:twin-arginine translocase TatA/TatE family subunit [Verrucomicrobiae bacterium]